MVPRFDVIDFTDRSSELAERESLRGATVQLASQQEAIGFDDVPKHLALPRCASIGLYGQPETLDDDRLRGIEIEYFAHHELQGALATRWPVVVALW